MRPLPSILGSITKFLMKARATTHFGSHGKSMRICLIAFGPITMMCRKITSRRMILGMDARVILSRISTS
jgi:hypothetical protein